MEICAQNPPRHGRSGHLRASLRTDAATMLARLRDKLLEESENAFADGVDAQNRRYVVEVGRVALIVDDPEHDVAFTPQPTDATAAA